jgi:hypothetical protein
MSMVFIETIEAMIGFKTWSWTPADMNQCRAHLVITFTNAVGFFSLR